MQGKVKFYNDDRGFGFIIADDGSGDVFFHVSALPEEVEVSAGQAVTFDIAEDKRTGRSKAICVNPA